MIVKITDDKKNVITVEIVKFDSLLVKEPYKRFIFMLSDFPNRKSDFIKPLKFIFFNNSNFLILCKSMIFQVGNIDEVMVALQP